MRDQRLFILRLLDDYIAYGTESIHSRLLERLFGAMDEHQRRMERLLDELHSRFVSSL